MGLGALVGLGVWVGGVLLRFVLDLDLDTVVSWVFGWVVGREFGWVVQVLVGCLGWLGRCLGGTYL